MHFEKISFEQWRKDLLKLNKNTPEEYIKQSYNNIKIPKRATKTSAGYDFFNPLVDLNFPEDTNTIIPTGIRWCGEDLNKVLIIVPRSGLGFKYGTYLRNTLGVIDSDYQFADNEGHILISLTSEESFVLKENQGMVQGIIIPFLTVDNEEENNIIRKGGLGSTSKEV